MSNWDQWWDPAIPNRKRQRVAGDILLTVVWDRNFKSPQQLGASPLQYGPLVNNQAQWQITCIQGSSKQDPGLSSPASKCIVTESSAVMLNDTFSQVLVSIPLRVRVKEVSWLQWVIWSLRTRNEQTSWGSGLGGGGVLMGAEALAGAQLWVLLGPNEGSAALALLLHQEAVKFFRGSGEGPLRPKL
jgi:hypothetical protein